MRTVIIHFPNQDHIVADMEMLPNENSAFVTFTNPRLRTEQNVGWATPGARSFLFPWAHIDFIEVMPSKEEESSVIKPFRD